MKTIFIKIQDNNARGVTYMKKFAVSLNEKYQPKIKHFIQHIVNICELRTDHYELYIDDGFVLANNDSTRIINEHTNYHLRRVQQDVPKRLSVFVQAQEILQQEQRQTVQQKNKKTKLKEKKIVKKSSVSQQSQSISQNQSQQQSQQSLKPVPRKIQKIQKPLSKIQKPQNKKQTKTSTIQTNNQKNKKKSESSQQSSSESVKLPTINKPVPRQIVGPQAHKQAKVIVKPIALKDTKIATKALISDSSESEPSQQTPKNTTVNTKSVAVVNKEVSKISQKQPLLTQPKFIPPALRNKPQQKSFQAHKQSQWIPVIRQKLKLWKEKGNATFCQVGNKIRFKIVELDEQRFVPIKSGWISGQVKEVVSSGKIVLSNVQQEGKPFRNHYELQQHNMDQLQLFRLLANKQQLQCLSAQNKSTENKTVDTIKQVVQPQKQQKQQKQQDKNSIQKFICGQVNFYFSDKNYPTDLYMQMHANRDADKYLPLSFMLNFPKIKKVLRDQQKLLQYLKGDDKYSQRHYQINFQNRKIRRKIKQQAKKVVQDKKQQDNKPQSVQVPVVVQQSV